MRSQPRDGESRMLWFGMTIMLVIVSAITFVYGSANGVSPRPVVFRVTTRLPCTA